MNRKIIPLLLLLFITVTIVNFYRLQKQATFLNQPNLESALAQSTSPVAFPGAEGFGVDTITGGRGGRVIKVTNLNDNGQGSLRECVELTGKRTCVFTVAGTIILETPLEMNSDLTIAGQSAPRGGITLKKDPTDDQTMIKIAGNNIIIRYIRMRPGAPQLETGSLDGITMPNNHHIVLDHVSISWSIDEGINSWTDGTASNNITLQRSIVAEGLHHSIHPDDADPSQGGHSKGGLFGEVNSHSFSVHHNLIANNADRNLKFTTGGTTNPALIDYTNNVMYNFGYKVTYIRNQYGNSNINFVGNYILQGPSTGTRRKLNDFEANPNSIEDLDIENVAAKVVKAYVSQNVRKINPTTAQTIKVDPAIDTSAAIRFNTHPITILGAEEFYQSLINPAAGTAADVGANRGLNADGSFFYRPDAVDKRILAEMEQNTGRIIDCVSPNGLTWQRPANKAGDPVIKTKVKCSTVATARNILYPSSYTDVGVTDRLHNSTEFDGILEGWPDLNDVTAFPIRTGAEYDINGAYVDTDSDGMSDIWEQTKFSTLSRGSNIDSSSDFDTDGYTDLEEFLNGTNPADGVSSIAATVTPVTPDPTSDNTPAISGSATATGSTVSKVEYVVDSTAGTWNLCTANDGTFNTTTEAFTCTVVTPLADGSHTIYVKATAVSNAVSPNATDVFTVTTQTANTPPSVTITPMIDPTKDTTPSISGTATDSGGSVTKVEYAIDSTSGTWNLCTANDGTFNAASEAFTCTVATAISNDSHTMYIRATDNLGARSSNASDTFIVDNVAPTKTGTPSTSSVATDTTPTWTWTASSDAGSGLADTPYTIQWSKSSSFSSGVVTAASAVNSYTHTTALTNGKWYFRARAKDMANNVSAYSTAGTFVVDTVDPTVPGTPTSSSPNSDRTPTWTWTASTDSGVGLAATPYTIQWSKSSSFSSGVSTATSTTNTFTHPTALTTGTWYFRVKATDKAGNVSNYSPVRTRNVT